tara:strand:- start:14921 stop:15403 length:483 start_codon:yes stop_codon:yes gene_type:complete
MNGLVLTVLVGAALVVLVSLAAYAWILQRRIRALEIRQRLAAAELNAERDERRDNALLGIGMLANAMLREEVTLTEGSIRLAYLLTQVDAAARQRQEYSVFYQLAEATAHIPMLDAWQALPQRQQRELTIERENIEALYKDFVLAAARGLLENSTLRKNG